MKGDAVQEQLVYSSPAARLSLKRAERIVPPEFIPCYRWFQRHTGTTIPQLPHHMKVRPDTPIPLSRDSGIYIPGRNQVTFSDARFALSIHSSGDSVYPDREAIHLKDGTWLFDYAAHAGSDKRQGYNGALLNCLRAGVPVGVMVKRPSGGYLVLGLAFVERYNAATHMFTMHGPVSSDTEAGGSFDLPGFEELPKQSQDLLLEYDGKDERRVVMVEQVRREQQQKFRANLLRAYNCTCAITGTHVSEVLQAAHINPYRGKHSQVVNNGLLLRADLHLLYDAYLISVNPDTFRVELSDRLIDTGYLRYNKTLLRLPADSHLAPSQDLLGIHYDQFRRENPALVA